MVKQAIVSQAAWVEARVALLAKEKELTRQRDALARERQRLPWVKVNASYVFDGVDGKVSLGDLFGGKSQLVVYHFMFGPEWAEGCPSCSFVSDHLNGMGVHLAARDVSLVAVSRAEVVKIEAFKQRMGWAFDWVSSLGNSFNHDFGVYFTPAEKATGQVRYNYKMHAFPSDEAPGASVFYKDPETGEIYHTYSAYSRGLDALLGAYVVLEMTPKGRDEEKLAFGMQWVRHHDRYEAASAGKAFADADKPYWPKVSAGLSVAASEVAGTAHACCGMEKK